MLTRLDGSLILSVLGIETGGVEHLVGSALEDFAKASFETRTDLCDIDRRSNWTAFEHRSHITQSHTLYHAMQ